MPCFEEGCINQAVSSCLVCKVPHCREHLQNQICQDCINSGDVYIFLCNEDECQNDAPCRCVACAVSFCRKHLYHSMCFECLFREMWGS